MDLWFSSLMSQITNLFISAYGKKGAKMTKPKDFLPVWYEELKEEQVEIQNRQSTEEMKQIMMGIAERQNTKVNSKKDKE